MKKNPLFSRKVPTSAKGYSAFPLDHFVNMTSIAGYLLPVFWDYLEPGDKVTCKTLLRTRTQPLAKPAMATCIERIEWFAVPITQLYRWFSAKYYGIQDYESDITPTGALDDYTPWVNLDTLNNYIESLPTTFTAQSSIPVATPTYEEAKRLADCIGLPYQVGIAPLGTNYTYGASISVLPFAAYQKIYYDHYRLSDREVNDPQYYNLDTHFGDTGTPAEVTSTARLAKLLFLHKRPYMRDYFTSMQVSPLMGSQDVNAVGNDLGAVQQWLSGLQSVKTATPANPTSVDGIVYTDNYLPTSVKVGTTTGGVTGNVVGGVVNPATIRSLFAVEKLLEVTRRARKHYDMQTLAHFGVKPPKGLSGECYKLGTHEQYLKIGDVMSTADTGMASLGQLAGQGSSAAASDKIHFEADCHCVLMAIYSCEPVVNQSNEGCSRLLSQIRTSEWYKSEFDNLGMQPVFRKELYLAPTLTPQNNSAVIGWQYRYYQSKSRYNRSICGVGSPFFYDWSLVKDAIGNGSTLSRNFFYVWPTDLNNILQVQYTGSIAPGAEYSEDYLINQIYFDIVKSSKKSIYGEPNL